ncbi:MAG: hypothetical protein WD033_08080 [Nitrosopumilaceae archaeon]
MKDNRLMYDATNGEISKALVTLAIEKTLLTMGKPVLDEVAHRLFANYKCFIPDCHEHPEYLKSVLKELYGNCYNNIVKSIKKNLEEFATKKSIEHFLTVISE